MKSMSSRVLLIALLLPVSAFATGGSLAWNGKAPSDPAKQIPSAEASASVEAKSEAGAAPAAEGSAAATAAPAVAPSAAATASASAKPAAASSGLIAAPPAGKGQIVFFRPNAMGMAIACTVKEGETKISSLGNGKYFILVTEPGTHNYSVHTESTDALTLLVEPDETQFVRCKMKMGIIAGRPDISPATGADFAEKSEKLKLVDDDDMGEGALRAAEIAAFQ